MAPDDLIHLIGLKQIQIEFLNKQVEQLNKQVKDLQEKVVAADGPIKE